VSPMFEMKRQPGLDSSVVDLDVVLGERKGPGWERCLLSLLLAKPRRSSAASCQRSSRGEREETYF